MNPDQPFQFYSDDYQPDASLFYAEMVCDRIEKLISETLQELPEDQSAKVEVLLPNGKSIQPTFFGYQNPNFVTVEGLDDKGDEVYAILSHTNIQILITKTTAIKKANKIHLGFQPHSRKDEVAR